MEQVLARKLFRLMSRMCLWRNHANAPSRKELEARVKRFQHEQWLPLIHEARAAGSVKRRPPRVFFGAEQRCMLQPTLYTT
eukprot:1898643-Alexandrium_andersonii.AAC.1